MKFATALRRELCNVDEHNWREKLDALKAEEGTWKKVAERLGVDRRTPERWRYGYNYRGTHRQTSDATIKKNLPKISEALRGNRMAQLRAVDWSRLFIIGVLKIGSYPGRREHMSLGRYIGKEDIEAIADAYRKGDYPGVNAAMDQFLSDGYTGSGDARLLHVEKLTL